MNSYKTVFILTLLFSLLLISACERNRTEVAASGKSYAKVLEDRKAPSVSALPATVNLASVSAAGDGGPVDGKALYAANCSACHQLNGKGVPAAFPPLDASPYVTGDNVERMAAIMIYGLQGKISVLGQDYNGVMAPLGRLKDKELVAIANYVRSSWSNKAGAVDQEVFANARAKYGSRGMFDIAELGAE